MVRARYDESKNAAPTLNQVSTMSLVLGGVIATTSFADDGEVFVMVMLASVVMLAVLLPVAAEVGRRSKLDKTPG